MTNITREMYYIAGVEPRVYLGNLRHDVPKTYKQTNLPFNQLERGSAPIIIIHNDKIDNEIICN